MRIILDALVAAADQYLADRILPEIAQEIVATQSAGSLLRERLRRCCRRLEKPLILLLDEVDSLVGDTLISLLRQIRAGYPDRPSAFPQTVLLCGVRDVRDYRIHNGDKQVITSGSAFNIKSKSLRLGNFSHGDLVGLYAQHTEETGQAFEDGLIKYVFKQTNSQPWLVNALGYEACFRAKENRDCTQPITLGAMAAARERLIERRDTRLDQLVDKLREPRVHRIISELLSGAIEPGAMPPSEDDQLYVQDLGLICTRPQVEIANPIYREIIPRTLTWIAQTRIPQETAWYVDWDGRLDFSKLLNGFQQFFRENSEIWIERFDYKEAGPQLLMQAFLQRIVNSGGRIDREYGLGRRTDLLVQWPLDKAQGFHGPV